MVYPKKFPRYVYAIYTHSDDGKLGVYVGSSAYPNIRIESHKYDLYANDECLSHCMRKNGYDSRMLDVINNEDEACLEYDWIDFYDRLNVRVFNKMRRRSADYRRCILTKIERQVDEDDRLFECGVNLGC